jgi:hypothetical protein
MTSLPEQANPGPQSPSVKQGACHCGTHALSATHDDASSEPVVHIVPMLKSQRSAGPQSESL